MQPTKYRKCREPCNYFKSMVYAKKKYMHICRQCSLEAGQRSTNELALQLTRKKSDVPPGKTSPHQTPFATADVKKMEIIGKQKNATACLCKFSLYSHSLRIQNKIPFNLLLFFYLKNNNNSFCSIL